jgi:hypothetical protein
MSKISITPNASGTGVFTISSPATNTNRTLTLPDITGTLVSTDASGNVGIGETVPFAKLHISDTQTGRTAAATVGNLLVLEDDNNGMSILSANNGAGYILFGDVTTAASGGISYDHTANKFNFRTNDAWDRMTIDSSGNVLVGKTSANTSTVGVEALANGEMNATVNGGRVISLDRLGSDGEIIRIRKSSTTVGSIGASNSGTAIYISAPNENRGIKIISDDVRPTTGDGTDSDNSMDLGNSTVRWDDVYATNGTIQTSDRNEKQDIDVMSEAETRVAVACKGLIRKFRWKDAVAEKGDDARIHFGIIAQDLQDAFAAEGLDAGRYAMFISSTWWEADRVVPAVEATDDTEAVAEHTVTDHYDTLEEAPEGATERTRLGVRYPELLAFIIGAL